MKDKNKDIKIMKKLCGGYTHELDDDLLEQAAGGAESDHIRPSIGNFINNALEQTGMKCQ